MKNQLSNPPSNPTQSGTPSLSVKREILQLEASFSGPLPPPSILKHYEEICPGAADRLIRMVEQEGAHRKVIEIKVTDANVDAMKRQFREARWGQILAFLISLAFLITGAYTAIRGQPWVGGVLGTMGLSSIVTSFIAGRSKKGLEETEPPKTKSAKKSNR